MVGVDTTFIIDLFRGEEKAFSLLDQLKNEHISTTVINMAELYRGAFLHKNTDEKLKEIEELKNLFIIFDMRLESAMIYGKIYSLLRGKGRMAKDRDILIASIFLSYGETKIITRDEKHFQEIPGLQIISY